MTSFTFFKQKSAGFGVIEVLIAMAILFIAAVGITQLEVNAIRAEYDATTKRTVLMLLQDMADRIRANRYDANSGTTSKYNGATATNGVMNTNCIGAGNHTCFSDQLAQFDIWEWGQYITALLPASATASITASGTVFTVSIRWPNSQQVQQTTSIQVQPPAL